jgi:hypothetical protein
MHLLFVKILWKYFPLTKKTIADLFSVAELVKQKSVGSSNFEMDTLSK